jgi:hypothetical protein
MAKAIENGYTIVRLLQTDVWDDENDWKVKIEKELYERNTPEIIYLYEGEKLKIHLQGRKIKIETILVFDD